jgi:transcriptional regulator with XRE-family HTH domain
VRLNRHALSAIRQRSGLTKSEFARALEVSPPHVTDLEAGRRQPSPALLLRMAGVLKVPVTALLADPEQAA